VQRVLVSLWLAGAVIYTANTLLLGDKRVTFGDSESATPLVDQRVENQAASSPPRANSLPDEQEAQLPAPELESAPSTTQQPRQAPSEADSSPEEWGQLLRAANARTGPSLSARSLRVLPAGTQLQVIKREKGWVLVTDPSSSEQGWIYEQNLTPLKARKPEETVRVPAQTAQGAREGAGPMKQRPVQDSEQKETRTKQVASEPRREKVKPAQAPKLAKSRKPPTKHAGASRSQARQGQFQAPGDRRMPRWDRGEFLPPDEGFWALPPTGRRGQRQFADEYIPPRPGRGSWRNRPPPPWESDW
jgi:hypothetical protein